MVANTLCAGLRRSSRHSSRSPAGCCPPRLPKDTSHPSRLLLKDSSSLLSVVLSMAPVERHSELPWGGREGGQSCTSKGPTRSRQLRVCRPPLPPGHIVCLVSGGPEGPGSSLAWSQPRGLLFGGAWAAPCLVATFLHVAEDQPGLTGDHRGWVQVSAAHAPGWFPEFRPWFCSSPCPVGFPRAPCTKGGERPDTVESLTPVQLALGVKGPPTGILFVVLPLSGSLAEAGKQGLYKQSVKAIVFWAMNRSGEGCFLSPICRIVDPFRQNKRLHKSQGPASCFSIVWV